MKTQRQKMLAGELYDPSDADLVAGRSRARDLCRLLNNSRDAEQEKRRTILIELFGRAGESVWMQPPFYCDYGSNIELGERVTHEVRLEIVCKDDDVERAVQLIRLHGRTGQPIAGWVYVSPVERAVAIDGKTTEGPGS